MIINDIEYSSHHYHLPDADAKPDESPTNLRTTTAWRRNS
jgi:hypothetical protein